MNRQIARTSTCVLLLGAFFIAGGAPLWAAPCTGNIVSNILPNCRNLAAAMNLLPCGITDLGSCTLWAEDDDCFFGLGSLVESDYILVEWDTLANKTRPSPSLCRALARSVEPCGGWEPLIDCPDPLISDDDDCDPDFQFCFGSLTSPPEKQFDASWGNSCQAYALMPRGWDEWTAARGFFTVGRTFPVDGVAWEGADEGELYSAEQALNEGLLGPRLLGIISGRSPLWGGGKDGLVQTDRKALEDAGLCANPQGALLASPFWNTPNAGVSNFPILARCDGEGARGLGPYSGKNLETGKAMDEDDWKRSGVLAEDVLETLKQLEKDGSYEVVCVTQELASERRALRKQDMNDGQLGPANLP